METKQMLRPCDCKDIATANRLNEQGIGHNDDSISIEPNTVILKRGHTTMLIPMSRFKMFAEWYLTEQEIKTEKQHMEIKVKVKVEDLRIGQKVYHSDIYWAREEMKVVGLRETEVELEGDYSGGTHAVCQKSWMPIEGVQLEYNTRVRG